MRRKILSILFMALFTFAFTSCREKSDKEKMEDKVEDVADDVEDAAEDVGDGIEDAADDVEDAVD